MTTIINGSSPSITFSDGSAQTSATRPFQNRIINGAMVIDQRNAGASVTPTGTQYITDRWALYCNQSSKFSVQQNAGSVTPPVGFTNYLGATSLSAYSVGSSDFFMFGHRIEGFNTADLGWGSASAKTVCLSFWVRSSLTGTFGGSFVNSAGDRSYPFTYTISTANTWEQKSITVAGDTSGTWLTTNGIGISVYFGLGTGSTWAGTAGSWSSNYYFTATGATSVVGTNGATFYITGVQLEVGSTATSFDYRPFGTEFQLCQRYFWKPTAEGFGIIINTVASAGRLVNPVSMRTAATISSATFAVNSGSAGTVFSSAATVNGQTIYNSAGNWTVNAEVTVSGNISAEL